MAGKSTVATLIALLAAVPVHAQPAQTPPPQPAKESTQLSFAPRNGGGSLVLERSW